MVDRLFALGQALGLLTGAWGGWRAIEWMQRRGERDDEGRRD